MDCQRSDEGDEGRERDVSLLRRGLFTIRDGIASTHLHKEALSVERNTLRARFPSHELHR